MIRSFVRRARVSRFTAVFGFAVLALVACSSDPDPTRTSRVLSPTETEDAATVDIDRLEIVHGVPDNGRDPAVVAIKVGDDGLCTGTLIAPRIVLTARHCVANTLERIVCPAPGVQVTGLRDPGSLGVYAGEDLENARLVGMGAEIVAPEGVTLCEADIALLILDRLVKSVRPAAVRPTGPVRGESVRAVGFGRTDDDDPAGQKLLREYVPVLDVSHAEFQVGEATCNGDSGGPALDPDTGEILGVVSRGGPTCSGRGVHNIYTRVDAFYWLIEEARRRVELGLSDDPDALSKNPSAGAKPGTKSRPDSDTGGPCVRADECASGVCVTDGAKHYCSRPCGAGTRCPNHFRCTETASGKVCLEQP